VLLLIFDVFALCPVGKVNDAVTPVFVPDVNVPLSSTSSPARLQKNPTEVGVPNPVMVGV